MIKPLAAIALGGLLIGAATFHALAQQQQQLEAQQAGDLPPPLFGPPPPQTRLEAIAAQKGILISKGYTDVGQVQADDGSRLRVTAVRFSDAQQSQETGIVVSIEPRGGEAPVIAYVDAEELEALAAALDALAKVEAGAAALDQVEATYRTQGDLEFTNHASNGGGRVVSVRATQILLPSGQVLQATVTFRPARLPAIREQIVAARELLNRPQDQAKE